ncbi:MAG: protein phosphatase 2C domain-containing protein, partial [Synergistaceae bacterium]|nr:protein phosphatase 2C domain-containing protein [Synergistaceae bacterium]
MKIAQIRRGRLLEAERRAFCVTEIGASHLRTGKICQDYSACSGSKRSKIGSKSGSEGDGYLCVAVSDGHGADDYVRSDRGAEFAASSALESVSAFMREATPGRLNPANANDALAQLEKSIVALWYDKVHDHFARNPFTDEETAKFSRETLDRIMAGQGIETAYGATLLAVVVCPGYWFGLHIGDGKCVVRDYDGMFRQPVPWDKRCFLNVTTSLCDTYPTREFRHYFGRDVPAAVFIGTDGIDRCFADDARLCDFYDEIIAGIALRGFDSVTAGL